MKVNHGLIIISMVIISLLAVGAVSASENVSDVIETADIDEVMTVQDSVASENATGNIVMVENNAETAEILSVESESEPVTVNVGENEIIGDSSSINRFDWNTLYKNTSISDNTLIYDFSDSFGKNKGSSFLVLDLNNIDGSKNKSHSFLVLGLSSLLGLNSTNDNSYLVFGLSSILDDNNTDDNSYLVLDVPNVTKNGKGNASLILDLTNILNQNGTSKGSFLYFNDGINSSTIDLSNVYKNNTLLGVNLTDLGMLSSLVDGLNLTDLTNFNLSSLVDGLNLTDLTNFNLSSLVDGLNLTNLTDWVNGLNLTDLFDLSSLVDGLNLTNLTDLINNLNWTNIISGNDTSKDNNTGFDWDSIWDSIFGRKDDAVETIIKVDPSFTRQTNDYSVGERGAMFYATLTDINGNPLVNKTVQIAVGGPVYTVVTDDQGRAGLQVNFASANTYTYALSFQGDDQYKASPLASTKLTVTKKKTTISASSKKFKAKAKKTVSVTLKTVKNPYDGKTYLKAGKKITLKVNGKTYTAKINAKGVAKFNLKLTKKGKYTAAISFKGDNTYKASSKKISIQIK